MSTFWTVRVGVFAFVLVCTFIVLGISANAVATYSGNNPAINGLALQPSSSVPAFAGLALAVAIITLLTVAPMLVIDFLRRGAISSWVVTELAVLGVLTVLWLAAAAESVAGSPFRILSSFGLGSGCGVFDTALQSLSLTGFDDEFGTGIGSTREVRDAIKEAKSLCQQQQALQAFGFLGWLALLGYVATLLAFAIIASNRGNKSVWQSTVRDTDFSAQPDGTNVAMKQQTQQVYPQQSYTPTAYTQTPVSTGGQFPQQPQQFQAAPVQYAAQV